LNTRDVASEYRLTHWAQVIQDRNDSGSSIKEYCKDIGIHENTYYYWLKKLRETACTELAKIQGDTASMTPMGFTEVKLPALPAMPPAAAINENQISIEAAGMRITAGFGYPVAKLAELLREVAQL
jgi:putative transposase